MTAAIADWFSRPPEVEVHYSAADSLCDWERRRLGINGTITTGFARHISLNIDTQPVLMARSVTALSNSIEPLLSQLQQVPLARLLFEDEQWQRQGAPIPLTLRLPTDTALYGRACVWQDQRTCEHLLVEEFFNFDPESPA